MDSKELDHLSQEYLKIMLHNNEAMPSEFIFAFFTALGTLFPPKQGREEPYKQSIYKYMLAGLEVGIKTSSVLMNSLPPRQKVPS